MNKSDLSDYIDSMSVITRHFGGSRSAARKYVVARAKGMACSVKTAAAILASALRVSSNVAAAFDEEDIQAGRRHQDDRR